MAKWDRDDTIIALEAYRNNATSAQIEKIRRLYIKPVEFSRLNNNCV